MLEIGVCVYLLIKINKYKEMTNEFTKITFYIFGNISNYPANVIFD